MRNFYIAVIFLQIFAACNHTGGKSALFSLLPANETSIDFQNSITESDSLNALSFSNIYHGSGVGIGDFNNDSLPDIFFAANMVSSRLYLNKGGFTFTDITGESGLTTHQWINGVSVIDINHDGWKDIYLCVANMGDTAKSANLLYINQGLDAMGVPVFKEMAAAYGLDNRAYSMQAAFFDYDGDGDLDMYLLNNGRVAAKSNFLIRPRLLHGESETTDCIYRNDGGYPHPHFTDVSKAAGIGAEGFGLGIAVSDLNHDGLPDIYVSNDYISSDLLWMNNGDGTFTDKNKALLQHTSLNGMGVDISDINNDGWYDIMQVDMLPKDNFRRKMMLSKSDYNSLQRKDQLGYQAQFVKNTLQMNNGQGPDSLISFSEVAEMSGVAATDWSWAPLLVDFDNDGWKDLYISNGYRRNITDLDFIVNDYRANNRFGSEAYKKSVYKEQLEKLPEIKLVDFFYRNQGDGSFQDETRNWGIQALSFSTGAAYADLDRDGDADLVINTIDGPPLLYKNNCTHPALQIQLKGDSLNPQGIGSKLQAFVGKQVFYEELYLSRGYLSTVDENMLVGIGNPGIIDSVIITWPDQNSQTLYNIDPGERLVLDHRFATKTVWEKKKGIAPLLSDYTGKSGVHFLHQEDEYIDFDHNSLVPYKLSQNGPCLAKADVDGDGREDFFVGGSNNSKRLIYYQQADGSFRSAVLPVTANYEDVSAIFFDADNDKDPDLYVVSGSCEYAAGSDHYRDRLYINKENGVFEERLDLLPTEHFSGSCVAAADYDRDGDMDLFVGGRIIPGQYPLAEKSFLLRNEKGKFAAEIWTTDIVNDAVFADIDNDGDSDLVTCGEFSTLRLYLNERGHFRLHEKAGDLDRTGWWTCLAVADMDGDGDLDIMAGNLGTNTHYRASKNGPLQLFALDYDNNGSIDPVMAMYIPEQGGSKALFPIVPRDQLVQQVPSIRRQYDRYEHYAKASLESLLGPKIKDAYHRSISTLNTMYFENRGSGTFHAKTLPAAIQSAPVHQLLVTDINADGKPDILAGGNDYTWDAVNAFSDASHGWVLKGDGKGNFEQLPFKQSGFFVKGAIRAIQNLKGDNKKNYYLIAVNGKPLRIFRTN